MATAGQWPCLTTVGGDGEEGDEVQFNHVSKERTGIEANTSLGIKGESNVLYFKNQTHQKLHIILLSHFQIKTALYHILQISCFLTTFENV